MLRRYLSAAALAGILCIAFVARAQSVTPAAIPPDTGRGIRLGHEFTLHLSMGIEFDWDSNVYYQDTGGTNAFFMRLNPGFLLTNQPRLGKLPILFEMHGDLSYIEYLSNRAITADNRQFNVDAGMTAGFFQLSPYNFTVFDNYVRSTQPPYTQTTENFNRDTNDVGTRINLSPGGGRLTFNVGYIFGIDYFENANLHDYDVQSHRMDLRASWRFLPKTAFYIAATEDIYLYPHPNPMDPHPDSYSLRAVAGVRGLITYKLTVDGWIGYANGFYQWAASVMVPHENPSTAIGGVGLTWKPTMLSTGSIGYVHDFQNSLLGAYYDEDMAYLSWTQLIWRFTGFVRFQYANMRFKGVQPIQATTDGTDNYIILNVRLDYPFKEWLIASVGDDLYFNKSDRTITGGGAMPAVVPVNYTKDVVYVRLTFQY